MTRIEFEGPRLTVRSDIETTEVRYGYALTFIEGVAYKPRAKIVPDRSKIETSITSAAGILTYNRLMGTTRQALMALVWAVWPPPSTAKRSSVTF